MKAGGTTRSRHRSTRKLDVARPALEDDSDSTERHRRHGYQKATGRTCEVHSSGQGEEQDQRRGSRGGSTRQSEKEALAVARRPVRRKAKRTYHRDARGRFAPTGHDTTAEEEKRRKRRKRAAVAGSAVAVSAVAVSQTHPASRTRTAATRRKIVRGHVARAGADHAKLSSLRARAFPTTAVTGKPFNAKTARREGRKLTKGYRKGVKSVRKARRKER
jgi:hypothetical protein